VTSHGRTCEHTFVPWLRCPNCSDWAEPQHWERGTHANDPHAVRCPSCGKWCDPSDQTMRIGERPRRNTGLSYEDLTGTR
jgi:hypothetical protein